MAKRKYVPSGRASLQALPAVAGAAVAGGVLVGVIEGVVSQAISLILIFPVGLGLAAGFAGAVAVEKMNVRGPVLAALLGAFGALAGQGSEHAVEAAFVRSRLISALAAEGVPADALDAVLVAETGRGGFLGVMALRVAAGVTIGRHGSGIPLKGPTIIGLWCLEFAIAMGIGGAITLGKAAEPFCERCQRWYDRKSAVLAGNAERWPTVTSALERGDWSDAVREMDQPTPDAVLAISLQRCRTCLEHEPVLSVDTTTARDTNKPQTVNRLETLVSASEASDLMQAIAKATV